MVFKRSLYLLLSFRTHHRLDISILMRYPAFLIPTLKLNKGLPSNWRFIFFLLLIKTNFTGRKRHLFFIMIIDHGKHFLGCFFFFFPNELLPYKILRNIIDAREKLTAINLVNCFDPSTFCHHIGIISSCI